MLATLRGLAVRGPMIGAEHAYAPVAAWLKPHAKGPARARAGRARTPLHAGPRAGRRARPRALVGPGAARRARRACRDRLRAARATRRAARAGAPARARRRRSAPPRLLGAFDPLLLGWCSREPIVGQQQIAGHRQRRCSGRSRWCADAPSRAGGSPRREVELEPFERLTRADAAALAQEADDVLRFLALRSRPAPLRALRR